MSDAIIRVEKLGKRYRIGAQRATYDSLRESVYGMARSAWRRARGLLSGAAPGAGTEQFWALKDISFEVRRGEVVGVIGRNGAGKSTLLKILSRITEPTEGRARLFGRVRSLLEVGTGFHPELTGRENIYLSGAILGMRKAEIDRKFDEIAAFAEVEQFLDTPVKRYSSGMYVRLGFAVAAHLEPEILLIDEVLAVGDMAFQKKCLGKMDEVARGGRTVLFVSHNMAAVRSLCGRAILLEKGKLAHEGTAEDCVEHYLGQALKRAASGELSEFRRDRLSPESPASFARVSVNGIDVPAEQVPMLSSGDDIQFELELDVRQPISNAMLAVILSRVQGERVAVVFSGDKEVSIDLRPPKSVWRCRLRALPLSPGDYKIDLGVNSSTLSKAYDVITDLPAFCVGEVPQTRGQFSHRPWGAVHWDQVEWESVNP